MSFVIDYNAPEVVSQTIGEACEMLQALLRNAEVSDSQREALEQGIVLLSQNSTPRYVYRCEPQWGDAEFGSLAELEQAIRSLCEESASYWDEDREEMVREYEFPADGLREGRDYTVEER